MSPPLNYSAYKELVSLKSTVTCRGASPASGTFPLALGLSPAQADGSFLIRKSSGQDSRQPYTLVVFFNRRVYNIPIRFIESTRQYALGREKCGEEVRFFVFLTLLSAFNKQGLKYVAV
uniref:SH2 domain-containing protein n=1 Tax=Pavo cristatus TaxID=9049 RepID=A0A8C9FN29_PAVCR